jgi:hypothetical protein
MWRPKARWGELLRLHAHCHMLQTTHVLDQALHNICQLPERQHYRPIICTQDRELQRYGYRLAACRRAASAIEFSPDSQRIAVVDPAGVSILDAANRQELQRLEVAGVAALAFSPKGTYLATYQRPAKQEDGSSDKNLKVLQSGLD